ncbi:hypothetical protein DPMN_030373 [Dreissena polymorpha]|uniref:Uncharacterized protein n=1 Tax=Dreissena polymorpha TaxID=45954 RepID=A0A9D4LY21_DREPO|nr:hypothetical protein DPMN_030373 [Dreissena polymorpha]
MQTNGKYGDLQPRHTIIDRESFAVFSLTNAKIANSSGKFRASSRLETFIEMHQHFILFNIQTPARILAEIVAKTRFVFMQTNGTSGDLQPRHTIIGCGIYKTAMASMVNSPSLILA